MGRPNFGHIERLGPDRYRIWWGRGYRPDGKRDRRSKTVHGSRQDAEVELARMVGGAAPDSMDWGRFWRVYVEPTYDGLADKTVREYRRLWSRELEPRIASARVSDTDYQMVDDVLSQIASHTVQRAVMRLWRKGCNIAVRRRILPSCPIDKGTALRPHRPKAKALLDASDCSAWLGSVRGLKYEPYILVLLGGGLRPEEGAALSWSDIGPWENGGRVYALVRVDKALTVAGGKVMKDTKNTSSEREVVIGEPFASRLLELAGEGPIVPSERGVAGVPESWHTSQATITRNLKAWCAASGVRYVCPKNLRSTFATWHGEAGSPDSLVSGAMGHSDGTTRGRHYQAVTRRGLALIADNLADFLASL